MRMFNSFRAYLMHPGPSRDIAYNTKNDMWEQHASTPPATFQLSTLGFVKPEGHYEHGEEIPRLGLTHELAHAPLHYELRQISRNVPAAAVRRAVAARVAEIQQQENRRVGGREKQEIKMQSLNEMLPKAFLVEKAIRVLMIGNFLVIDQTSESVCDAVLSLFRDALGTLNALPLRTVQVPHQAMTQWVLSQRTGQDRLALGNSFKVKGISEKGLTLSGSKLDLSEEDPDFVSQIVDGREAEALGLFLYDENSAGRIGFTLTKDLVFKGVRWPDEFQAAVDDHLGDQGDVATVRRVNLALVAHGILSLIDTVTSALGGLTQTQPDEEEDLL